MLEPTRNSQVWTSQLGEKRTLSWMPIITRIPFSLDVHQSTKRRADSFFLKNSVEVPSPKELPFVKQDRVCCTFLSSRALSFRGPLCAILHCFFSFGPRRSLGCNSDKGGLFKLSLTERAMIQTNSPLQTSQHHLFESGVVSRFTFSEQHVESTQKAMILEADGHEYTYIYVSRIYSSGYVFTQSGFGNLYGVVLQFIQSSKFHAFP